MSETGGRPELGVSVIGAFRVLAHDGEDLTPRGRKARALLAILALTPSRRRSRSALQDKLWSDRGPEQGGASLRQTLTEIRRAFGERYRHCLISDLRGVGFAEGRVWVDLEEADLSGLATLVDPPRLLDDLDIADGEFEDWLRNQRAAFEERLAALRSAAHSSPGPSAQIILPGDASPAARDVRPWVRLLPPLTANSDAGVFLSRFVGSRVAQGLADQWGIDIRDDGKGMHGVQLRVDALPLSRDVLVDVALLAADDRTQLWSGSETISLTRGFVTESQALQALINRATEIAGRHLSRIDSSSDASRAFLQSYEAVQRMFKLDLGEIERADALLASACELDPKSVYLAWRAYARVFYIGEHLHMDRQTAAEEAEELARRAIEAEPHNATTLALASYVNSFILHRFPLGHELAELSVKYNPAHPLGHAFLGRAKSYLGDHEGGYREACRGRELSGMAPYLYMLHTLCGMTALLSGRFDEAVRATEIAAAMAPAYRPPQRTLVPLYLRLGEGDKARHALERLRRIEPTFSLDAMRETSYPSAGIRASGLLSFSDRDL